MIALSAGYRDAAVGRPRPEALGSFERDDGRVAKGNCRASRLRLVEPDRSGRHQEESNGHGEIVGVSREIIKYSSPGTFNRYPDIRY